MQTITVGKGVLIIVKNNIQGQKFNKLLVVKETEQRECGNIVWECLCECGKTTYASGTSIKRGNKKSCGCLHKESMQKLMSTHGKSKTAEYRSWCSMINRCSNKNSDDYKDYGGRGIKVCDRWRNDFTEFLKDMGERPSKLHSIDRIDVDGDYDPTNCRWDDKKEQAENRRNNLYYEYKGEILSINEWANKYNMSPKLLYARLNTQGWSIEKSLTTKLNGSNKQHKLTKENRKDIYNLYKKGMYYKDIAKIFDVSVATIAYSLKHHRF